MITKKNPWETFDFRRVCWILLVDQIGLVKIYYHRLTGDDQQRCWMLHIWTKKRKNLLLPMKFDKKMRALSLYQGDYYEKEHTS